MNIDNLIDGFTARLKEAGIPISNIDAAPWVDDLELKLAKRLPRSFSSLVRRYAFPPFEWQSLYFFGNSGFEPGRGPNCRDLPRSCDIGCHTQDWLHAFLSASGW